MFDSGLLKNSGWQTFSKGLSCFPALLRFRTNLMRFWSFIIEWTYRMETISGIIFTEIRSSVGGKRICETMYLVIIKFNIYKRFQRIFFSLSTHGQHGWLHFTHVPVCLNSTRVAPSPKKKKRKDLIEHLQFPHLTHKSLFIFLMVTNL